MYCIFVLLFSPSSNLTNVKAVFATKSKITVYVFNSPGTGHHHHHGHEPHASAPAGGHDHAHAAAGHGGHEAAPVTFASAPLPLYGGGPGVQVCTQVTLEHKYQD